MPSPILQDSFISRVQNQDYRERKIIPRALFSKVLIWSITGAYISCKYFEVQVFEIGV